MQKRIGNYQLVSELGKGQFGVVYKAVRLDDPSAVFAVKCIPKPIIQKSKYMERLFETETGLMFRLDSPHIMKLYEINETQNNYYLVMTYCDGGDLDLLLNRAGRFAEDVVVRYLQQLAAAFRVFVANKVMHRDIKLANLFLAGGRLVVGDLGFCRAGAALTSTQLGTPLTMSPEMLLCRGEVEYDNRTDLWSIGIVLYQMLYGRFPFEPETAQELMHMVQHRSGDALAFPEEAGVSLELRELIKGLLQFNPARRLSWDAFFGHRLVAGAALSTSRPTNAPGFEFSVADQNWALNSAPSASPTTADTPPALAVSASLPLAPRGPSLGARELCPRLYFAHEERRLEFALASARALQIAGEQSPARDGGAALCVVAAAAVFRKGLARLERVFEGLARRENPKNAEIFNRFLESPECAATAASVDESIRIAKSMFEVIFPRTLRQLHDAALRERLSTAVRLSTDCLEAIDELLSDCFDELRGIALRAERNAPRLGDLCAALLRLRLHLDDERHFALGADGEFDWPRLREGITAESALRLIATP